ncbi:MAG: hypothetical protein IEMM0008_1657 [bacterium]|nr:MAG: hypothetical protein IEMM0008_1657 [bacterium]
MASYKIVWKSSSERDLRKIPKQYISRVMKKVESLQDNPFPIDSRKLQGSVFRHRVKVEDYRVIYEVNAVENILTIFRVRHRKDAYQ